MRLREFDDRQVQEYASRWFALDETVGGRADELREAFIAESRTVSELRSNPLMLGLMCTLYRTRGHIPRNRPGVYRECAKLLFEDWDKRRGIEQAAGVEQLLQPALRHLAFWLYTEPSAPQRGVPEEAAIRQTAKFLDDKQFGNEILAEQAARTFIAFCRGRSWVFSDIGTGQAEDGRTDTELYGFTHRTFLEYFTAEQLVSDHQSTKDLERALRPKILRGEWEMVSQLAVHIKQEINFGSADEFIGLLLDSGSDDTDRLVAAGFAARVLHGITVSAPTCRKVVSTGRLTDRGPVVATRQAGSPQNCSAASATIVAPCSRNGRRHWPNGSPATIAPSGKPPPSSQQVSTRSFRRQRPLGPLSTGKPGWMSSVREPRRCSACCEAARLSHALLPCAPAPPAC
jgi:hypothetical protein